jgi:hypothetical protein
MDSEVKEKIALKRNPGFIQNLNYHVGPRSVKSFLRHLSFLGDQVTFNE